MPLGVHVAERAGVVGVLFLLLLRARPPREAKFRLRRVVVVVRGAAWSVVCGSVVVVVACSAPLGF